MSVLGIDVGTSGCKACAFSAEGVPLARRSASYGYISPRPDWMELDPELLWRKVRSVIRATAREAAAARDPVCALAMATMGDSLVAVDRANRPLSNYILYSDRRSVSQAGVLASRIGPGRLYEITGMPPHPMHTITKILWMMENQPELCASASHFLCCEDFLISKLGLRAVMSHANACRTMAFSIAHNCWSEEVLAAAGVSRERLPDVCPSGHVVGIVPAGVARQLGLGRDVRVVAGGLDQPCGVLGSKATSHGDVQNAIGTQEILAFTVPRGRLTNDMFRRLSSGRYSINSHVLDDAYMIMGMVISPGLTLRWLADLIRRDGRGPVRDLSPVINEALQRPPTHVTVLPHFAGRGTPGMDPRARGALIGLDLSISDLDLVRAVLQGVAYEAALNIKEMEAIGLPTTRIRCVGGGSRSDVFLQFRADVFSREVVRMREPEAAMVGAAALAGAAVGEWDSIEQAVAVLNAEERLFRPDAAHASFYQRQMELHAGLNELLKPAFEESTMLAAGGP